MITLEMNLEQKVAFDIVVDRIDHVLTLDLAPSDFYKVYPQLHLDCIQFIYEFLSRYLDFCKFKKEQERLFGGFFISLDH